MGLSKRNHKPAPLNTLMLSMLAACIILILNVFFIISGSGSTFWESFHRVVLSLDRFI